MARGSLSEDALRAWMAVPDGPVAGAFSRSGSGVVEVERVLDVADTTIDLLTGSLPLDPPGGQWFVGHSGDIRVSPIRSLRDLEAGRIPTETSRRLVAALNGVERAYLVRLFEAPFEVAPPADSDASADLLITHDDFLAAVLSDEVEGEVSWISVLPGLERAYRADRERIAVLGSMDPKLVESTLREYWRRVVDALA